MNRLAISVQMSNGSLENSVGPGWIPYDTNAVSITAAVALVGSPSDSIGTNVPAAEALLAASGPATPSIAPLPNSPLCFDSLFSVIYDKNVGSSAPPAGSAPNGKPKAVPRSHGFQDRRQSSRPIHGLPTGMTSAGRRRRWAATHSASPTAKMATAITTMSIPSDNCGRPNVAPPP